MTRMRNKALAWYAALVLLFLYLPMAVLAVYSFNQSRINAVWTGWTLEWYVSLFHNRNVLEALWNSVFIAVCTMLIATVIGTAAAIVVHRHPGWRKTMNSLMYMPILIPDILMGLSLIILFRQFGIPLGKWSVIAAHVTFSIPFVFLLVITRLAGMGSQLEEAATDLGATPFKAFRFVTLPGIAPAVAAGMLLTFTMSLDDFVVSFFVAGPNSTTLPLYIYGLVKRGVSPEVNALSTLMIAVTMLLVFLSEAFRRKGGDSLLY